MLRRSPDRTPVPVGYLILSRVIDLDLSGDNFAIYPPPRQLPFDREQQLIV
jgi:hypothetical protein